MGLLGIIGTLDEQALMTFIDETLCEINDDYPVERKHALREIKMKVLKTKTFYQFMESKGKTGGQNKFPRVLKNAVQIQEWENYLANN
jgi:hypothetical protein